VKNSKYKTESVFSLDIKLAFIYPATPLHIKKYSKKQLCLISETRHRYETIVQPYIEKNQLNAQWVYNIIDGKSERERILFETDQFIVLPDIMWDGKAHDSLHILGLVKSHDIRSIRDLKSEHIPMLEDLLDKITVKSGFCADLFIYFIL
jgi:m7GpppX diphosphatase